MFQTQPLSTAQASASLPRMPDAGLSTMGNTVSTAFRAGSLPATSLQVILDNLEKKNDNYIG